MSDKMQDSIQDLLKYDGSDIHVSFAGEKHRLYVSEYLSSKNGEGIENQAFEVLENHIDESVICYDLYSQIITIKYNGLKELQKTQTLDEDALSFIEWYETESLPPIPVEFTIHNDDSITVQDFGRGVPCDTKEMQTEDYRTYTSYTIFPTYENDSTGGKAKHGSSKSNVGTTGMHGAGGAVAVSCSEYTKITSITKSGKGGTFELEYKDGRRVRDQGDQGLMHITPELAPHPFPPLAYCGVKATGTTVHLKYDRTLFNLNYGGRPMMDGAFNKEAVITRMKLGLIGLEHKRSTYITFKYHDEEPVILTPWEITPAQYLKGQPSEIIHVPIKSASDDTEFAGTFRGAVFIRNTGFNGGYTCRSIINRLPQTHISTDDKLAECLNAFFNAQVSSRVNLKNRREVLKQIPPFTDKLSCLVVFYILAGAEFSGQTKQTLTTNDHMADYEISLINNIMTMQAQFEPWIDAYCKELIELDEQLTRLKKLSAEMELQTEIEEKQEKEDAKTREKYEDGTAIKETKFQYAVDYNQGNYDEDQCILVIAEGLSAKKQIVYLQNMGYKICYASTGGKIGNPYILVDAYYKHPKLANMKDFVLKKKFKAIYILTDADPDGAHIRALMIAILFKYYRKQWIDSGKTFIIKTPYALVSLRKKIKVPMDGYILTLDPNGINYVCSELELIESQKYGARLVKRYCGLHDSLSDGRLGIGIDDLVTNPDYITQVAPATDEDASAILSCFTKKGAMKSQYTKNVIYSEQEKLFLQSGISKLSKVPLGKKNLIVSDQPKISNYLLYETNLLR